MRDERNHHPVPDLDLPRRRHVLPQQGLVAKRGAHAHAIEVAKAHGAEAGRDDRLQRRGAVSAEVADRPIERREQPLMRWR